MSLNKFKDCQTGRDLGLEIGCANMACTQIDVQTIVMPPGGEVDSCCVSVSDEFKVTGSVAEIDGVNFVATNSPLADQVLKTDGLGATYWSNLAPPGSTENLQEGYNVSDEPQIITSNVVGKQSLQLKQGGSTNEVLKIVDSSDETVITLGADGQVGAAGLSTSSSYEHINLKDSLGATKWTVSSVEEEGDLLTLSSASTDAISVGQAGSVNIDNLTTGSLGMGGGMWSFTSAVGTNGQVLAYNSGVAEWTTPSGGGGNIQDAFDQSPLVSVGPAITTADDKYFVVRETSDCCSSTEILQVQNSSNTPIFTVSNSGVSALLPITAMNRVVTNVIVENDLGSGVTVDGVLCKDSILQANRIEYYDMFVDSMTYYTESTGNEFYLKNTAGDPMLKVTSTDFQIAERRLVCGPNLNLYRFPADGTDAKEGDVLVFGSGSELRFTEGVSYSLPFGGLLDFAGKFAIPSGIFSTVTDSIAGFSKDSVVPSDSFISGLSYSTQLADATSVFQLLKNGVAAGTVTCTGSSGATNFAADISVAKGDKLSVKLLSGTAAGGSNLILYGKVR